MHISSTGIVDTSLDSGWIGGSNRGRFLFCWRPVLYPQTDICGNMKSQINVELLCLVGSYLYTVLVNMAPLPPSSALMLWGRPLYIFIFWGAFTLWPFTWRLKDTCKCCKLQQLRVYINSYSKQNSYHHHWALLDIVTRLSTVTAHMVITGGHQVSSLKGRNEKGQHLKSPSLNLRRQALLKHASVNCSIDKDAEGSVCKRISTN